jgi:glycosyltransferase involved in cell wall biosynthesis
MAVGTPVITPGIAGALDFVTHDLNGLLVPPRDPGAIAKAVGRLIAEPELSARLGRAAERDIENKFDIAMCADRWESVLEEVAHAKGYL